MLNEISNILVLFILLYILIMGLYFIQRTYKKEKKEKKEKYTMEFCLNDKTNYDHSIFKYREEVDQYFSYIDNNQENWGMYLSGPSEILNRFEKISIAVDKNMLDEDIIKRYYAKYFILYYEILRYPIMEARNDLNSPLLFIEFEKKALRWMETGYFDYNLKDVFK